MSNEEIIQEAVDWLVHDVETNETFPEGLTARDVRLYIKGTYGVLVTTEEIINELIRNEFLELTFRLKDAPSE